MSLARGLCIVGVLAMAACQGAADPSTMNDSLWTPADEAAVDALPQQVCTPGQPDPRACAPSDTKKTTVCHIPPGNPANEHTICVGDAAVPAHLAHGDKLGSCCGSSGGGGGGASDGGGGGVPAADMGTTGGGPIG